ncbi:uncharacterized protein [Henckelia pumila]|uniref:uncharacterized protein n=1 Tax=Henckelia pumila TaxID=405737 RepID=UPI003C6E3D1E
MTSSDNQPLLRRTPAAVAASPENVVPPHNGNQALGGIVLCFPAQRKNSTETISATLSSNTSLSQHLDSNANTDAMTSSDLPNQSLSQRTLAAAAASPENLVPPHDRNRTLGGIILCLPAQRKNSRTAPASSGNARVKKVDNALHRNTVTLAAASTSSSGVGTTSPLANPHSIGDTGVPSQNNFPRKPKELARNDIRRMLMDKARTKILCYLND